MENKAGKCGPRDRLALGIEVLFELAHERCLLTRGKVSDLPYVRRMRAEEAALRPERGRPNLRFDVLIVGSGYGGAVMAARLAATGKRVAVLERGREYLPGEFPADVRDLPRHVRIERETSEAIAGSPEGLFDVRNGANISVIVGNALGGTSQINAAVVIPPKSELFDSKNEKGKYFWPQAIRNAAKSAAEDGLEHFYDRARQSLGAEEHPAYQQLPKYQALSRLAAALDETREGKDSKPQLGPLKLAIAFKDGPNPHGVLQGKCLDCGNCVSGCNYWAKSTLTMNYLPLAHRLGAELYTGARVVAIEPSARRTSDSACEGNWFGRQPVARWIVHVERTADEPTPETATQLELYADTVVLAAGTLGSTEILLRSRNRGYIRCSDALGTRFSGNGDMIAMGYRQKDAATAIGRSCDEVAGGKPPPGPTAVGVIDLREGAERFIIEDGAIPYPLEWLFREIATTSGLIAQLTACRLRTDGSAPDIDPLAADKASAEHTMPYLLMGSEQGSGHLGLEEEARAAEIAKRIAPDLQQDELRKPTRLRVRWPLVGYEPIFGRQAQRIERAFKKDPTLGVFLPSPVWKPIPESVRTLLSGDTPPGPVTTVHPLGGCPMGDSCETGVVDHAGQVFLYDPDNPTAAYAGLYVADGSIIPMPLSANPLLTIAALAERAAPMVVEREKLDTVPHDEKGLPAPYLGECRPEPERLEEKTTAIALKEALVEEWEPETQPSEQHCGGILARRLLDRRGVTSVSASVRLALDICLRPPAGVDFNDWLNLRTRLAVISGEARIEHKGAEGQPPVKVVDFTVTGTFGFLVDELGRPAVAGSCRDSHARPATAWVRAVRYAMALWHLLRVRLAAEISQEIFAWIYAKLSPLLGPLLPRVCALFGLETPGRAFGAGMTKSLDRVKALASYLFHMSTPRYLTYDLTLEAPDGARSHLRGEKIIAFRNWRALDDDALQLPGSPWLQISEVPLELQGVDGAPEVVGRLCIDIEKLAYQRLPQIESATSAVDGYQALVSFALLFARGVLERHVLSFKAPSYPAMEQRRARGTFRVPGVTDPEHHWIDDVRAEPRELVGAQTAAKRRGLGSDASPGLSRTRLFAGTISQQATARILLTRYRAPIEKKNCPAPNGPLLFIHGFLHSGLIFCGDLKPGKNAVAYFCEQGFDVWVLELRTSTVLGTAALQWTYDDVALGDIPRAVDYVREATGFDQISVIAHCMGAAAFSMAVLDGRLERTFSQPDDGSGTSKVRRAVLSQVGPLITPTAANSVRAKAAVFIRDWLGNGFFDAAPDDSVTWRETIADRLAYSFPVPESSRSHHREGCLIPRKDLVVCNRLALIIGRNWIHKNLAKDTHKRMYDVLGAGNLTSFLQMAKFMERCMVTDQHGQNWYCLDTLAQRHFDFPVLFLSGAHNDLFDPETTQRSHDWLQRVNPTVHYARREYKNYCHLDCWLGKDADKDIWSDAADFLGKCLPKSTRDSPTTDVVLRPEVAILGWTRYDNGALLARIYSQVPEFELISAYCGVTSVGGTVRAHLAREGILSPWFVADVRVSETAEDVAANGAVIEVGSWHPERKKLRVGTRQVGRRLPMHRAAARRKFRRGVSDFGPDAVDTGVRITISGDLAQAIKDDTRVSFFVGSCRWPGTLFEEAASDTIFASILDKADRKGNGPCPSFLLLVGDQVYMDAAAELFETRNIRERFREYYKHAFGQSTGGPSLGSGSPNFAKLVRRLPTYMAMDDHEIVNDWTRSRLAEPSDRFRWRIAKLAYRQYQWSHGPGPNLEPPPPAKQQTGPETSSATERTPADPSEGEFPLWYDFKASGFPLFVMDARSERDARYDKRPMGRRSCLVSGRQLQALLAWLKELKNTSRPKFIVSGSVLFPMLRETASNPAYAWREDSWHGYPETRDRVLRAILDNGVQNVVFIGGDAHVAAAARVSLKSGNTVLDAYCITASGLYTPFPFANARPGDYLREWELKIGDAATASYEVIDGFVSCRNFTQITVEPQGSDWRIRADVYGETGRQVGGGRLR